MRLLAKGRLIGAFVVTYRISGDLKSEGSGFVLNITISEPYIKLASPDAIPELSDSSTSVAAPAVSQAPRSRLGSSDRLTLRDVARLQL